MLRRKEIQKLGLAAQEADIAGRTRRWAVRTDGLGELCRRLTGSMATLAMMYEQGLGVERDPDAARRLYERAGV